MTKQNKNKNKNKNSFQQGKRNGDPMDVLSRAQRAPVALSKKSENRQPKFKNEPRGVRITHTEYVADVLRSASSLWNLTQSFVINPGNADTFPWLSQIAINFETYKIHKLRFMARTQQPSTVTGAYYMCYSYDADDSPPGNKQVFMAERSAVSAAIWQNIELPFIPKAADMYKELFVNVGVPSSFQYGNAKLYNAANMYIAVDGNSGSTQLADLFVEYDISFYTPSIVGFAPALYGENFLCDVTGTQLSNGATFNNPANPGQFSILDSAASRTGKVRISTPGSYLLEWYVAGTSGSPSLPTWTSSSADTVYGEQFYTPLDTGIGSAMFTSIVQTLTQNVDVTLALSVLASLTSSKLRIAPIPFSAI